MENNISPAALTLTLALITMLGGCSNQSHKHLNALAEPSISYLDSKYRVCRKNCPVRTPKVLDDVEYISRTFQPPFPAQSPEINQPAKPEATFEIQFEFDKRTLTKEGEKTLESLTQMAKLASSIELVGGTDDIGTEHYNDKLAQRRVAFVANWLKQHGIKSKISVEAKGACCHPSPYTKTEAALIKMRRVQAKVQLFVQPVQLEKEIKK